MKVLCMQAPRMSAAEALPYVKRAMESFTGDEFQMLVLPEKWITTVFQEGEQNLDEILGFFQDISEKFHCTVIPGSFSLERNGRLYNTSPFIYRGKIQGFQDKITLFKAENGKYASGDRISIFEAGDLRVAIAVCYDLDFPYFAKIAARNGASLIVNPSLISAEFKDMWHIYVKGRSLETRLVVISVNSVSEPFQGGSIVTRMQPRNGGIFLGQELLGMEESRIVETNPEEMHDHIEARQREDPGNYGLEVNDA